MAEQLPFTYTGADFYALCSDAMLKAVTRQADVVDTKIKVLNTNRPPHQEPISTAYFFDHHVTPDDVAVMVTEQDFIDAHRDLIPSVSAGELVHYERVRATFEGGRENGIDNGNLNADGTSGINGVKSQPLNARALGLGSGKRTVSGASRGSGKGKGKAVSKGRGKAVALRSDDEYDEEGPLGDEQANGGWTHRDKGKGVAPFYEGGGSDDEALYDE